MSEFDKSLERNEEWNVTIPIINENGEVTMYKGNIYKAEEGGFWGKIPSKPGCATQGETFLECMRNLREALTGILETENAESD